MVTTTVSPAGTRGPATDADSGDLVLRVVGSSRDGQLLRLKSPKCTVGSGPHCTLRLRARGVGSLHCLIVRGRQGTVVRRWARDTRLNDRAFHDAQLTPGDRLAIGPIVLEVVETGQPLPREDHDLPPVGDEPTAPPPAPEPTEAERQEIDELQAQLQTERETLQCERQQCEAERTALQTDRRQLEEQQRYFEEQQRQPEEQQRQSDEQRRQFDEERRQWQAERGEAEQRLCQRNQELDALQAEIAARGEEIDRQHRQWQQRHDETERELSDRAGQLEAWQADLESRQAAISARIDQQDHRQAELDARRVELDARQTELEAMQTELEASQAELKTKQTELEALQAELERVRAELERAEQRPEPQDAVHVAQPDPAEPATAPPPETDEAEASPGSSDELVEVLRRMGRSDLLLDDEDGIEPAETAAEPADPSGLAEHSDLPTPDSGPQADAQPAPASGGADSTGVEEEEEESIDDYMARLMSRVQGVSRKASWASNRAAGAKTLPAGSATASRAGADDAEQRGPGSGASSPAPKPVVVDLSPRAVAPEKQRDLSAMRELANISAHKAIGTHAQKRLRHERQIKLLGVALAVAVSAALLWMYGTIGAGKLALLSGMASLVVALLWVAHYATMPRRMMDRLGSGRGAASIEKASPSAPPPAAEASTPLVPAEDATEKRAAQ